MTYSQEWWRSQADLARITMESAPSTRKILIEAAAQHPLSAGTSPNTEFQARLDRAAELAVQHRNSGWSVSIYVPGSRHREGDIVDARSLSSAGVEYLESIVTSDIRLHGDDLNHKYLPSQGVYGSADECFVTASYFRDGNFERLAAVVSPQQLTRKLLHYIAFAVEPLMHTAPVPHPFHDIVTEVTESIPEVLFKDPTAQGDDSIIGNKHRLDRTP